MGHCRLLMRTIKVDSMARKSNDAKNSLVIVLVVAGFNQADNPSTDVLFLVGYLQNIKGTDV